MCPCVCECVCVWHKGRGSRVRCPLMTDSNRLEIVHPNSLSFSGALFEITAVK